MVSITRLSIALVLLAVMSVYVPETEANVFKRCYETWSRCSRWSKGLTGILWKSCDDRCKKHFKKNGGRCVKVRSRCPLSRRAEQCQCY